MFVCLFVSEFREELYTASVLSDIRFTDVRVNKVVRVNEVADGLPSTNWFINIPKTALLAATLRHAAGKQLASPRCCFPLCPSSTG